MNNFDNTDNKEQRINKPPMGGGGALTDTILMIEPVAFGYNIETAVNNFFQQKENHQSEDIAGIAHAQFSNMVKLLQNSGIKVIVVKDTEYPPTPDSIFPNNWISFHKPSKVVLYPMFAPNRRQERRMDVILTVENETGKTYDLLDYSDYELRNIFLEGTGSIVLDRINRIAYASLSQRTDKQLFEKYCKEMLFQPVSFHATQQVGQERLPIYHTNVMMCVGEELAVVCPETIQDENERHRLMKMLNETGKKIVEITEEQMHCFAGNMLQLKNKNGEKFMLMSLSAFNSLNNIQLEALKAENELIVPDITIIEKYGGGSVRCMVAEEF